MKQASRPRPGLVPVRCRVLSKETEDYYKKVKVGVGPKQERPYRKTTIETECELVPANKLKEEKSRTMAAQIALVKKEIERLKAECPECFEDIDQERLIEEIVLTIQEEKKKKSKPNPCGVSGNPYHDADTGRFTSPEDGDYCKSLWFSCRQTGRRRGSKGSKTTKWVKSPANAGRHTKNEPRKVKCSTGKKIAEVDKPSSKSEEIRIRISRS